MSKKILLMVLCGTSAMAATNYVDLNSLNPIPPYTNWVTAAKNIQDAVDAADSYPAYVIVADGHYVLDATIMMSDEGHTIESLNGPQVTIIDGHSKVQCISGKGGKTVGFTITGGWGSKASGVYQGIVSNCIISNCYSDGDPTDGNSILLERNGSGGALYSVAAYNCVIENNGALNGYGGAGYNCTFHNCIIKANSSGLEGGALFGGYARNCVFIDNLAGRKGSVAYTSYIYNSIISYDLLAPNNDPLAASNVRYCCSELLQEGLTGNIARDPMFVDGSYRLSTNSPCIDSGLNGFVDVATDLAGNPRVVNAKVDMGAYEVQTEETAISIPIRMTLEQSSDLETWTSTGEAMEWMIPTSESNIFYRAKLDI